MGTAKVIAGGQVSIQGLPKPQPADLLDGVTADIVNTTLTAVLVGVASNYTYLTQITIQNSHATVGTWVNVMNNGASRYSVYCAPGGGGATITFPENAPLRGSAVNSGWGVQCATTGANIRASATGFKATR